MNIDSKTSPRHWRVEDILGHLNDNVDKNNAEELVHCILTSTDILTWNLQGEIVYKGQNIRGTNIVDLLQYTILTYNTEIPEPAGLNIFLKGLAKSEIDKSLIVNGRVLTMLAHKQPLHDVDTLSDKSEDESENVDTTCNSCNKDLHIFHLGTCHGRFLTVADFHAPPITKRVRSQYAPWITNNIRQVMRQRDYLKKKAVKTGSKQFHDAYRRTRNDLNRLIKNTKAEYFMNTLNECDNNPKEMWKAVNKLTNKCSKTTVISEIHQGNQVLTKKSEIANALNTYFSEVWPELANEILNSGRMPESYLTYTSTVGNPPIQRPKGCRQ